MTVENMETGSNVASEPSTPNTPETVTEAKSELSEVAGFKVSPEHVEFYEKLYTKVKLDCENRLLIWKKTELANLEMATDDKVRDAVATFYEKWKAEQKPPTLEDIQLMCSQEYVTLKVKLYDIDKETYRDFTLRELPQSVERRFYRQFRERFKEYGPQINAFVQATAGDPEKMIDTFLDSFDNSFDLIAEGVAIVLKASGKENSDIDTEWVQNNVSSSRCWNIVRAQFEIQRLRDFFSQLYQAGQQAEMITTPLSFQRLQANVR